MKEFGVAFADQKLKDSFDLLKDGRFEDKQIYEFICRAIADLKVNPFCGIQIPKKLIPKKYVDDFDADNLWKYNLPNAWRLLYTITNTELKIIAVILEWMGHPDYERRFGYG